MQQSLAKSVKDIWRPLWILKRSNCCRRALRGTWIHIGRLFAGAIKCDRHCSSSAGPSVAQGTVYCLAALKWSAGVEEEVRFRGMQNTSKVTRRRRRGSGTPWFWAFGQYLEAQLALAAQAQLLQLQQQQAALLWFVEQIHPLELCMNTHNAGCSIIVHRHHLHGVDLITCRAECLGSLNAGSPPTPKTNVNCNCLISGAHAILRCWHAWMKN